MITATKQKLRNLIHESNLIEGYDDEVMDRQGMIAFEFLLGVHWGQLQHGDICKLQKIITLSQTDLQPDQRGYYRKIDVWIGGNKALSPEFIDLHMTRLLDMMKTMTPKEWHIEFEHAHPFVDGNGRTGRMLMWWHEMQLGQEPTLIRSNETDRHYYYAWFK